MVKINPETAGSLPARNRGLNGVSSFTLAGATYDYLAPAIKGGPEGVRSWEYGKYPKVEAAVPLTTGATVRVYGEASRWGHGHIIVSWLDDAWHPHWAWIPARNVRPLTDSEWDILEYQRCPPGRRPIRWGRRLPGFIPE